MLQELFNLVKSVATDTVINNPDVPNEQNNEVVAEATNTVASGLRNVVAGGGVQNLLEMFGSKKQGKTGLLSNPLVTMMIGHFANKLMNKYRMGPGQANNVANNLIPSVIETLINKTNDPNEGQFSLDALLNSITGGQSGQVFRQAGGSPGNDLNDLLNQFGGGNQQAPGGGGLMDIVTKMAQGAQQQQQQNGGSLLDLIKGFSR